MISLTASASDGGGNIPFPVEQTPASGISAELQQQIRYFTDTALAENATAQSRYNSIQWLYAIGDEHPETKDLILQMLGRIALAEFPSAQAETSWETRELAMNAIHNTDQDSISKEQTLPIFAYLATAELLPPAKNNWKTRTHAVYGLMKILRNAPETKDLLIPVFAAALTKDFTPAAEPEHDWQIRAAALDGLVLICNNDASAAKEIFALITGPTKDTEQQFLISTARQELDIFSKNARLLLQHPLMRSHALAECFYKGYINRAEFIERLSSPSLLLWSRKYTEAELNRLKLKPDFSSNLLNPLMPESWIMDALDIISEKILPDTNPMEQGSLETTRKKALELLRDIDNPRPAKVNTSGNISLLL